MAVNISEVTIKYSWILLLTTVISDCMYQPTGQRTFFIFHTRMLKMLAENKKIEAYENTEPFIVSVQ